MVEVFLDTSFAIALSSVTDQNHLRAVELAQQLEAEETLLVTTQAILLEIGNALSKHRYRAAAIQLLESLEADSKVEVVPLTERLYGLGFKLFREREGLKSSPPNGVLQNPVEDEQGKGKMRFLPPSLLAQSQQ